MILKPARSITRLALPLRWQSMPGGLGVLQQINASLHPHMVKMFGYHMAKVGALSDAIDTSHSPIKHQFTFSDSAINQALQARLTEWPFLEHSLDCLVLSCVLDYSHDPHQILREANRVLIANGHLIYVGFNPFSIAGLRRAWPWQKSHSVWHARFFSPHRVKDWMNVLGLDVIAEEYCAFSGLKDSEGRVTKWWHRQAQRYIPWSGSVYMIVAKKREIPLSLLKPKWKITPNFSPVKVSMYSRKQ